MTLPKESTLNRRDRLIEDYLGRVDNRPIYFDGEDIGIYQVNSSKNLIYRFKDFWWGRYLTGWSFYQDKKLKKKLVI